MSKKLWISRDKSKKSMVHLKNMILLWYMSKKYGSNRVHVQKNMVLL